MLFKAPKVIGLVLDLSLRPTESGHRLVDEVRKILLDAVLLTSELGLYLYDPELVDVFYKQGEKTAVLAKYETDGYQFDLVIAMRQSLYVLATEDGDSERIAILITDRLSEKDSFALRKFVSLNNKESFGCKCIVFGIGPNCNCSEEGVEYMPVTIETLRDHLLPLFEESHG